MGIGCVGNCDKAVSECPKHKPPVFNPSTQWLLSLLFLSQNDPHYERWQRLRQIIEDEGLSISLLRPTRSDSDAEPRDAELQRRTRGALGLPIGFRMSSSELEPERFRSLMEEGLEVLKRRESELTAHFGSELAALRELVGRMAEIGRCAEDLNNSQVSIVVFYGW